MKTKLPILTVLALCTALIFTACQKDNSNTSQGNDQSTQVKTGADDQNTVSSIIDNATRDVNVMVEATAALAGKGEEIQSLICDADVTAVTTGPIWSLTFTFNGSTCLGDYTRTGVIEVSTPENTHWKNAGAAVTVSFQNFKVTRTSDSKSVTLNGDLTYTNVSGGLLINLATAGPITHTLTGNDVTITFNDGSQRIWNVAKQVVFTYDNGGVATETGTHTEGSTTGVALWGTDRFGKSFVWQIEQPLVVRQDCNFRVVSGKVVNIRTDFSGTATFGLDAQGNPTSCPGTGHYYMKLTWTDPAGNPHSVILPY
ncbi:MAG: hypothetical protein LC128_10310 [Chitinophagales bacterium]|nr:hypothetical protein [Chitinophagales bacterium]